MMPRNASIHTAVGAFIDSYLAAKLQAISRFLFLKGRNLFLGGKPESTSSVALRQSPDEELERVAESSSPGFLRLPIEILEVIFYQATHDIDARLQSLVHISLVCRQLKEAVLMCPRLWSELPHIDIPDPLSRSFIPLFPEKLQHLEDMITLFLSRSGNHPINFQWCTPRPTEREQEHFSDIFLLLVAECRRWRDVTLNISDRLLGVASPIAGNLPLLRSLTLRCGGPSYDSFPASINHFSNCPSLRQVSLSVTRMSVQEVPPILIPWSQLTSFDNSVTTSLGQRRHRQSNIKSELSIKTHDFVFIQRGFPKTLWSHLSALTLKTYRNPQLLAWLSDDLILPRLDNLEISFEWERIQTRLSLTQVLSFLRRSGCPLRRLWLWDPWCEPGVLIQILSLCDGVEELALPVFPVPDVLKLVLDPNSPDALAPNLRRLTIIVPYTSVRLDNTEFGAMFDPIALTEVALSRDIARRRDGIHLDVPGLEVVFTTYTETWEYVFTGLSRNSHPPERSATIKGMRPTAEPTIKKWAHVLFQLCDSHELLGWDRFKPWDNRHAPFNSVLAEMEKYPVKELDVMLLQRYGILGHLDHWLGRCEVLSPTCEGCVKRHKIPARLQAIKDEWRPTIVSEAALYQRWAFRGSFELEYVPLPNGKQSEDEWWDIATRCPRHGRHTSDRHRHALWQGALVTESPRPLLMAPALDSLIDIYRPNTPPVAHQIDGEGASCLFDLVGRAEDKPSIEPSSERNLPPTTTIMFQRFLKPITKPAPQPLAGQPKGERKHPFERLLKSNKPPSEEQRSEIHAILHELKTRFQQDFGVAHSDLPIDLLPTQGQKIHEDIRLYQSLLSCIRTVPTEVLHTIFERVVLVVKPGYDQIHAVQTIRLVCRRWESVARKCASLWRNLPLLDLTRIPMSERQDIAFEKATNHLHSYLQRSVNMPLSFTFHFWPDLFLDSEGTGRWTRRGEAMEWLRVLHYEWERWGEVEFRATRAILRMLSDRIRKNRRLKNLTKFSFEIRGVDYPVTPGSSMVETIDLSMAVQLKHFVWDTLGTSYGMPYQETLVRLDLPWESLETFDCAVHEDTGIYAKLIEKATNLRVLKYTSSKLTVLPTSPTSLPHLANLSLCFGVDLPGTTLVEHLSSLSLPSLKELELYWWKDTTSVDFYGTLLALVQRSGCFLDRLATENNLQYNSESQDLKFGNFTKLLYHCRNFTHLDIGYLEAAELEVLVPHRNVGKKPALTTLRTLTVRYPQLHPPPTDPIPLLGLLQSRTDPSRKPPHSHLEDLYIKHHDDDEWRISVLALRDEEHLGSLSIPSDMKLCEAVSKWKADLGRDVFTSSANNGQFTAKRQFEVKQIFREMEKLNLEGRDARSLIWLGIPALLASVGLDVEGDPIEGDPLSAVRKQAADILTKWKPFLLQSFSASPYRWCFVDNTTSRVRFVEEETAEPKQGTRELDWMRILGRGDIDVWAAARKGPGWFIE